MSVNIIVEIADMAAIGQAMADDMFEEILRAQREGRNATLIVPVGPIEGFSILAGELQREKIPLREVMLINMDEYLARDGGWVPLEHPLSFRAFMNRSFYGLLAGPGARSRTENRVFPDPENPGAITNFRLMRGQ